MAKQKRVYHGWIVVEKGGSGFRDYFTCEFVNSKGMREHGEQYRDPAQAIAWWDRKVGQVVQLESTPLGAYRVYTEEVSSGKNS